MTKNAKVARVGTAPTIVSLLWPKFVERHGNIYLADCAPSWRAQPTDGRDNTAREPFHNHVHVLEVLAHSNGVWDPKRNPFKRSHPEFRAADRVGRTCAETWFAKLRQDFPNQHFRVYYSASNDPTVRFHRVYLNEPPWFDADRSPQ